MQEKPHHIAAYEFYRDMPKRSYPSVAEKFTVSVTSIKKWSKEFKWKIKVTAWDIAIRRALQAYRKRQEAAGYDTDTKERD